MMEENVLKVEGVSEGVRFEHNGHVFTLRPATAHGLLHVITVALHKWSELNPGKSIYDPACK